MKVSFTIYADLESLLKKMSNCHNNPEKSSTIKINKHARSQSYFKVPKDVRLNSTYVSIMKIANKDNFNKFHQTIHQMLTLKSS